MKYVHPDVLDNGPAHLRINATRALIVPAFDASMTYAQVLASALIVAPVSPVNFTLSSDGTGRKVVFSGATGTASKAAIGGKPLHIVLTDGVGRILLADDEASHPAVSIGTNYAIPAVTYAVAQPQ